MATKERTAKRHRPAGRSRQQARSGPEVCRGGQGSRSTPAPAENKIPRQAARERAAGALQHLADRRPRALPRDAGRQRGRGARPGARAGPRAALGRPRLGSNVLVKDGGFPGVVIRYGEGASIGSR